jgi:hypothetical protein
MRSAARTSAADADACDIDAGPLGPGEENAPMTLLRHLLVMIVVLAMSVTAAFGSATVYLKDGRVLEGDIVRETDSFIFVRVMIGGVGKDELVLRSDIERIEREPEPAEDAGEEKLDEIDRDLAEDEAAAPSDGAVRVAFITLEEMVGPFMFAPALSDSVDALEDDDADVVILRINSGGGALAEIEPLIEVIEDEIKPEYRVAAWIESAISAAAMTASICEEIYFMSEGNLGAATGFRQTGSGAEAMGGRELEEVLKIMEGVSDRGQKNPLVMRAMQVPTNLSADFTSDGRVVWRNDLEGEHIVATENDILTFDSQTAVKYQYARGVADTKDELMRMMGYSDWVEVGHDADEVQQRHREEVARGQTEINKAFQLLQLAMQNGDVSKARRYLGQLKAWATRNEAFVKYNGLSDENFRNVEREIDRLRREQRRDRRR